AGFLLVRRAVENSDVVFTAYRDPDFGAVVRKKGFVRRTPYVGGVLDGVGPRIDERDRVGANGNNRERLLVGREPHSVNEQLAAIERTEVAGLRIAEPDDTQQRVCGGIGY